MKTSGSLLLCDESRFPTLSDQLKGLKRAGFTAVDLGAFQNWGKGISPDQLTNDPGYFKEIVRTVTRFKIDIPSMNAAPSPELLRGGEAEIQSYAEQVAALVTFAREVGATSITFQVPQAPDHWEMGKTEIEFGQRWRKVLEHTGPIDDIRLSAEIHAGTFMERPTSALRVAKQLWPEVGITYDPSHQIMNEVPLADTLPLLQYVHQVHLRDASPGNMQAVYGEGSLDLPWMLGQLTKIDYPHHICIEYFADFDPEFASAIALKDAIEAYPA